MEKTCSTCRHLRLVGFDNACTKIIPGLEAPDDAVAIINRIGGTSYQARLDIQNPSKFGCLLHEPRPAEPKIPDELWGVFRKSDGELATRLFCFYEDEAMQETYEMAGPASDYFVARIK